MRQGALIDDHDVVCGVRPNERPVRLAKRGMHGVR
jgi:hypothetical protein